MLKVYTAEELEKSFLFQLGRLGTRVVLASVVNDEIQISKPDGSVLPGPLKGSGVMVTDLRHVFDSPMKELIETTLKDRRFVLVLEKAIYEDQKAECADLFKCELIPLPSAKDLAARVFDYAFEGIYQHPEERKWTQGELVQDWQAQWRNVAHLKPRRMLVPLSGDAVFVSYAHQQGDFEQITAVEWSAVALAKIKERLGGEKENVSLINSEFYDWHAQYSGEKFDLVFDKDAFGFMSASNRAQYCEAVSSLVSDGGFIYLETKFKEENRNLGPPFHVDTELILSSWKQFRLVKELGVQPADYRKNKMVQMGYLLRKQRSLPFFTVDVFSEEHFFGNALAVVVLPSASYLTTEKMQLIARWTNLSETTFIAPDSDSDYSVRIFTLDSEYPFAGHPTLGSLEVWRHLHHSERTRFSQNCGAGKIDLCVIDERCYFRAPDCVKSGPLEQSEQEEIMAALQNISNDDVIEFQHAANGPSWVVVLVKSVAVLEKMQVGQNLRTDLGVVALNESGHGFTVRTFSPVASADRSSWTVMEDPITGSLIASASQWLIASKRISSEMFQVSQGANLGRRGTVFVRNQPDGVWVGGRTRILVSGTIEV